MPTPDGYDHCRSGRGFLVCLRCGALVCTDDTTLHTGYHVGADR